MPALTRSMTNPPRFIFRRRRPSSPASPFVSLSLSPHSPLSSFLSASCHRLAVVHLVLFVVTVSSVHLVVTTSTASIDVTASPAPHVITGYAYCSSPHHIYSLHQRLHLGFSSVYSRSVNFGSPQAVKTKPFAGDPHRTPLTHPLQGTLHSIKLAVRASSGIDETRSSSDILDSSSTYFARLFDFSDEF
ncbi:hypothetical protein Bca4012_089768 [Brassica carinata]